MSSARAARPVPQLTRTPPRTRRCCRQIAKKNNVATKDLAKLNGIADADKIKAGDTILVQID